MPPYTVGREPAAFDVILGSLAHPAPVAEMASVGDVFAAIEGDPHAFARAIDVAIFHAGRVDRLGYAFAAGYVAATRTLLSMLRPAVDDAKMRISLGATEEGGAHPRAIRTALTSSADGGTRLTGNKLWCTLASSATHLLIIATEGELDGRPRLRAALVPRERQGLSIIEMPETPFCPEIRHARIEMASVAVEPGELIAGDAFAGILKPFRTVEDLCVQAALLAWLAATSRRLAFDTMLTARCLALLSAIRELASLPPTSAAVHIALGGVLRESAELLVAFDAGWAVAPQAERERFARDRPLLQIAARVRDERLRRAWEA